MTPHSSTLAWKLPWMEEPCGLQSMGSLGVRHDWATSLSLVPFLHWRRKWQPTPVFVPGESQGRETLMGCRLWGRTELDMTEQLTFSLMSRKYVLGINFIFVYICVYVYNSHIHVYVCVYTHTHTHILYTDTFVTIVCNMGDDTLPMLNCYVHKVEVKSQLGFFQCCCC